MELITKKAFAKRCGVSMPTVYKWIDKNKDGLRSFVKDDGIDATLFDKEPWSKYISIEEKNVLESIENAKSLQEQIDRLQKQINQQQDMIEQQKEIITMLGNQLSEKDREIQNLHILMREQLAQLGKKRRTFLEWLGVKPRLSDKTTE